MLTKTSAAAARATLGRLRSSGLEPDEYLSEVQALVRRVVPHDASGWMTLDPDSMLSSGTLAAQKPPQLDSALWRNELLEDGDVHKLPVLAQRPSPLTAISELDAATAEATRAMTLMPGDATSTLYAVAIGAGRQDRVSARARLTDGRWLLLEGGRMHGEGNESLPVTVSLLPAPRADLMSLLLRLHSLSTRQREVAELLMAGPPTNKIAAQLHISSHTLRDHIKAIFAKLGVQGRAELMALVSEYVAPGGPAPHHT